MSKTNELTLLYVEDDKELRAQFVRLLKPKFKNIYEASNGLEALDKYEAFSPDMMLVDINIPKVDGLEVIELIRNNNKSMPIVILSAYSDQKKLLRAVTLGLSQYLIKPVPQKKLLSLLDEMAENFELNIDKDDVILLQNGYSWKKEEKVLYYGNEIISLTKRERILLRFFIEQLNKVVTVESITNLIWDDEEYSVAYSSLSHLLKRLRKKCPEELIENIYGEGYKIVSV
ncbi:MAG: response regulator transcription factor [Campylobacterota bacterium]|nr:response regulator transcription factor [Campylobacterota bacterium]